jgi:hypothetical protein
VTRSLVDTLATLEDLDDVQTLGRALAEAAPI